MKTGAGRPGNNEREMDMKTSAGAGLGLDANGYVRRSIAGVRKKEHIRIAEEVLGKTLPAGAVVHHWNEDRADNRRSNLVICPNHAYHALLHRRMRALAACGYAGWRKCPHCKQYDNPDNMKAVPSEHFYYHAACKSAYDAARKIRIKTRASEPDR